MSSGAGWSPRPGSSRTARSASTATASRPWAAPAPATDRRGLDPAGLRRHARPRRRRAHVHDRRPGRGPRGGRASTPGTARPPARQPGHRADRTCCGRPQWPPAAGRGRHAGRVPLRGAVPVGRRGAARRTPTTCATRTPTSWPSCSTWAAVRMVTIAPELPRRAGRDPAARRRAASSPRSATPTPRTSRPWPRSRPARRVGTHVCNGMRPVHHREPGPVVALLDAPTVVCEQIADGVHLHDGMLRHAIRTAGPDRIALITDAIDAAGMPDGELRARRPGGHGGATGWPGSTRDGAIAGSTLTMDAGAAPYRPEWSEHCGRLPDGLRHAGSGAGARPRARRDRRGPPGRPGAAGRRRSP